MLLMVHGVVLLEQLTCEVALQFGETKAVLLVALQHKLYQAVA